MSIIDRYAIRLYAKVFSVCFISLTGLYVVIETLNNLDEFLELGKSEGGLSAILVDYFVARSFTFFDRTSHLLALMSAIFTLTWMQRTNEMTAVMAAGIPQWRVIKPLLVVSVVVSGLGVVNREYCIPRFQGSLVRDAQTWSGETPQPMHPRVDYHTDFFYTGSQIVPAERRIIQPNIHLDRHHEGWGNRITAEQAVYCPASSHHPAGYLCEAVSKPRKLDKAPSIVRVDETIVFAPSDHAWLKADECFVVSAMEFGQLVSGDQLLQYGSTWSLIQNIRSPGQDYGAGLRVTAHARVLRPVLDLSLLLIGLPIVVSRRDRNLFVAAGMCILLIGGFVVLGLFAHGLASYGVVAPFAGAWLPAVVFLPWAATALARLDQ